MKANLSGDHAATSIVHRPNTNIPTVDVTTENNHLKTTKNNTNVPLPYGNDVV